MVIVIAFFPDDSLEGSSTFLDTKPVIVYYIETYAVLVTVHCFGLVTYFRDNHFASLPSEEFSAGCRTTGSIIII
jgi:hypothetical protein